MLRERYDRLAKIWTAPMSWTLEVFLDGHHGFDHSSFAQASEDNFRIEMEVVGGYGARLRMR